VLNKTHKQASQINAEKNLNKFKGNIKDKASFDKSKQKVAGKLDGMNRGPVAKIWDNVLMLWNYVLDPKVPWMEKILPLGGLLYLISPFDAIPDVIPVLGLSDDVAVIVFITVKIAKIAKTITNAALDAVFEDAQRKGKETLAELNARAYKNLGISALLNGVMLLCAVLPVIFLRQRNGISILIAALVNYVILGRALFSCVRFLRTVLVPYHKLIVFVLPVFFNGLRMLKSLKLAIQVTIAAVFDYFYADKVSPPLQIVHEIASTFGLIKDRDEINDMVVTDFYPLVCRFLRVVLIQNVLLFTVCYGVLIFVVKHFVIGTALNMSFVDFFAYPFFYMAGVISTWR
jgi:uncharacterized membrane protein YkvA (DUF1232 family)